MKKAFLETGRIVGTHGVRGEVRLEPWCDSPDFLLKVKQLYLDDSGQKSLEIAKCRVHGRILILQIAGVGAIEAAERLRGKKVYLNRSDVPLPAGRYFISDLLGACVIDADSEEAWGRLTDVSATGANDVWHIRLENGKTLLFPAVDAFIVSIDLAAGEIRVRPPAGIFETVF